MIIHEFSHRKVKRKLQRDGIKPTIVASADLFVRKILGKKLFDKLQGRFIKTVERNELLRKSSSVVNYIEAEDNTSPPVFVITFSQGHVLCETGLVLTNEFNFLEESAAEPAQAPQAIMAMISRQIFYDPSSLAQLIKIYRLNKFSADLDTVAPIIPRYPNYYHWIVETVPQIWRLQKFEEATGNDITILIPENSPSFVRETLRFIEWPAKKIKRASEPLYNINNIVVPSYPEPCTSDLSWTRKKILKKTSVKKHGEDSNLIYISRSSANERRVINESEVIDTLSKFGFRRYKLEERTFRENVRLFYNADIVVGAHGAGLTDIIFTEGCTVIELFGEKVKDPYKHIADELGIDYYRMYCEADSADIIVDTKKLYDLVSTIIE